MKKFPIRALCILLSLLMLVSVLPVSAFASEAPGGMPVAGGADTEEGADLAGGKAEDLPDLESEDAPQDEDGILLTSSEDDAALYTAGELTIPGYTQVTQVNQIKADRKYLIVAQAPDGTLYALRISADGANNRPGASAYPNCAATLTVSGGDVSAVSTAETGTSIPMAGLHVTIAPSGSGYTVKNETHCLALTQNEMYHAASEDISLEISFVVNGRCNIYHREFNRYVTFNVAGASETETHFPATAPTGFCGWSDAQPNYIPIYLFIQGELPVDPGMNLFKMLSGDMIGGGETPDEDPDGQNSWVFTGGRAAQGSLADIEGARTWAGHFEEYVRYTHAKQLQPSGESTTPYFQRHVINAAYEGQELADIVSSFDTRILPLKPRAVSYLVDEGGSGEANFAANLTSLITKALALQNSTGMIVVATLTDADKTAVDAVVDSLTDVQKPNVLSVKLTLTDAQKTGGYPNASGHFAMAQQLADAIVGSTVSTAANWPYGAISGSVMASDFPNKTAVDAHHTYRTPSTLNDAQEAVQALAADTNTPATWLFMGDSITHGAAWTGGYDTLAQLFEKFVKDDLGRKQDIVINAGSSGANTESTLNDLNRRLVKYDPDVVVLMLGTNDAWANVSATTYKANLRAILDKIMDKGAVPVLRTPPPTSRAGYDIATYAGYIREIADESKYEGKVILVDQYAQWGPMNWSDVFSRDSLHPDEAGHLWFAHQLIKELALWDDDYVICQLEYVEMDEPSPLTIPGYTQLTNMADLDENKGYMIVSQDQAGNLFALYPSEEGKTLGSGALPEAGTDNVGARAASLTVSEGTVTAAWLKDNSAQSLEKLLFTIKQGGNGGYIFTAFNGRHLNMKDSMFTDGSVELTVTNRGTASLNAFEIKNTEEGRYLDFNKYGDSSSFQGGTWGTDFWCPKAINMPVYLFASDTAAVPTAKEGIEALINEDIADLTAADYTRASWAALQRALTAAREALASGEANGDAPIYVTARDALQSAYDNLQRKPVIPEVPDGATIKENASMIPAPGTTKNEPFASGTGGSNKFRIPAIITLKHQTGTNADKNGRLLAAIDARWNHTGDACGLDTIVSYSDDNGGNWNYNFPNYFGDSINGYTTYGAAFIDPVMVEDLDGTIYLMVDIWPGGVALNTAPTQPQSTEGGYVEIRGTKRLVLYTTPVTASQTDTNYSYYVGDFDGGYAPVYAPMEGADDLFVGYYVDEYYYLYHTDGDFASKTPANDKIYCQRLGEDSWVQQNVFFYNATLHVRAASYLWIVKSTDGGETWGNPMMINDQVRTSSDRFYGVGPGAGLCMEDGTLLLPVYIWPTEQAGFIYSKDKGVTWKRSDSYATAAGDGTSESCMVQLSDNTIRQFYRDSWNRSLCAVRYTDHTWDSSMNGGQGGWAVGTVVSQSDAKRWGASQVSAIKYSQKVDGKDLILYSSPMSDSGRSHGVIHAFLVNNDKTMTLYNTYSVNGNNAYAYSSLTETENGNIALLYESTSDAVIFEVIPISDIIPTLTVTGYEGAYDGQAHSVTVSASEGGTLQYSTDNGATWSSTQPTFTNAGTYTVKVKATWNGNNWTGSSKGSSTEATAVVTIRPITPTLSITSEQGAVVAPGQTITLTVHGVPAGTTADQISLACDHTEHGHDPNVVLTKQDDGTWTGTHETANEEAAYTFTASYDGGANANYNSATANYQVQVVDLGVTIKAYTGVYDGQPHSISVTAAAGITMTYCETEDGTYSSNLPTYTNAGTYTTYYKAVKGKQVVSGYAHVTISKATPVLTITCDKGTELSTEDLPLHLTISGVPAEDQGQFTLSTFNDALRNVTRNPDGTWTAAPQLPPVTRTYTFTAVFDPTQQQDGTAIENPNYERATAEFTVTVARPSSSVEVDFSFSGKVTVDPDTPIVGTYTVPYDGEPHTVTGALVCGEGVTVQYHVPITDIEGNEIGDTWVTEPPAYTQPGEYTVTCMGSKGNSAKVLTVVLKIVEGNIETDLAITPSASELTGGGELTLTVSGLPDVGSLSVTCSRSVTVRETGTRGVYTVTLPDADGTYTFTATYSGSGSYQPAEASCSVTVTKKDEPEPDPDPVVPSAPDTPSTSTEVKENPDGSTTTTVTDKKTGTVTETTEKPDGTKEIVETKKDGTVTETTERPDGSKESVETKKDGTVTETKVDPEGGAAEKVTDPEKNVAIKVTDADGEVLAEVKLPAEVTVPETRFADVPEDHWADEAIHEMAGLEIVNGVGNNEYNMNGSMKRGDLALLLARLSNAGTDYDVKFTDVPADKYYAGGVAWAAKAGVVTGRSEELFKPEDTITRGELAVMLYRYAKLLKMDTSASASELDVFTDGKDTAEWAADGVAWCVKSGIMQGKGGSILDSKSNVTRAEVAVMLQRFINLTK